MTTEPQYTLTPVELAIGRWLTSCLPAEYAGRIVAADQRNTQLAFPFATFKLTSNPRYGATPSDKTTTDPSGTDDDVIRVLEETVRGLVSVNVYGETSYKDLEQVRLKMYESTIVQAAKEDGISMDAVGDPRRIPDTTLTARTDRAQADYRIRYVNRHEYSMQKVRKSVGTGEGDLEGVTITTIYPT